MGTNSIAKNIWSNIFAGKPPEVNPEFKDFHCFAIPSAPWEKGYDINQDGYFGVDDMKARLVTIQGRRPIDENIERLEMACRLIRMFTITDKVSWHLRQVVEGFKAGGFGEKSALSQANRIKDNALEELEGYREEFHLHKMMGIVNCELLDLVSQAKEVISGEKDGHFAVGLEMYQTGIPFLWKGYKLIGTYPAGPAAGKLFRDDVILAIDGKKIGSPDMPDEMDPANGLAYGFGGDYNSDVTFLVMRLEDGILKFLNIPLRRTVWAAMSTNCEETPHDWDGTEIVEKREEKRSSGCSASPTTLPPRGPIDGLRDLGDDLGEWIYDVGH